MHNSGHRRIPVFGLDRASEKPNYLRDVRPPCHVSPRRRSPQKEEDDGIETKSNLTSVITTDKGTL